MQAPENPNIMSISRNAGTRLPWDQRFDSASIHETTSTRLTLTANHMLIAPAANLPRRLRTLDTTLSNRTAGLIR